MAKLPLNHIQNNEEGLSVRDKLNTVIDRINATQDIEGIVDDHKHDTSNPHKVKAPQVALEPIITPLAPNEQNVQDALEWLYGHFEQHANEGWHLDHIDGIYTVIQINRGPNTQFPPEPADLRVGELKLDWNEGKLWTKLGDDADVIIGGKGVIFEAPLDGELYGRKVSETDPTVGDWYRISLATVSDDMPQNPSEGDLWVDTKDTLELYVYIENNGWVSMTGAGGAGGGALPDNITTDNIDGTMVNKLLGRVMYEDGTAIWRPIYTDDVITRGAQPMFRKPNGQFAKATDPEAIRDQQTANWFLYELIQQMSAEGDWVPVSGGVFEGPIFGPSIPSICDTKHPVWSDFPDNPLLNNILDDLSTDANALVVQTKMPGYELLGDDIQNRFKIRPLNQYQLSHWADGKDATLLFVENRGDNRLHMQVHEVEGGILYHRHPDGYGVLYGESKTCRGSVIGGGNPTYVYKVGEDISPYVTVELLRKIGESGELYVPAQGGEFTGPIFGPSVDNLNADNPSVLKVELDTHADPTCPEGEVVVQTLFAYDRPVNGAEQRLKIHIADGADKYCGQPDIEYALVQANGRVQILVCEDSGFSSDGGTVLNVESQTCYGDDLAAGVVTQVWRTSIDASPYMTIEMFKKLALNINVTAHAHVGPNPPLSYKDGALWFDTNPDVMTLFVWHEDANEWEPCKSDGGDVHVGPSAPGNPSDGDFWFDNTEEVMQLFLYHEASDAWIPVAPPATLESRVRAGELTQEAIIAQIQQSLEDQARIEGRIDSVSSDIDGKVSLSGTNDLDHTARWRLKQKDADGGADNTYISIHDGDMGLYNVAHPTNANHAATMGYVDDKFDAIEIPDADTSNCLTKEGQQDLVAGRWAVAQPTSGGYGQYYIEIKNDEMMLLNVKEPLDTHHATNKSYVDQAIADAISGLPPYTQTRPLLWRYNSAGGRAEDLSPGEFFIKEEASGVLKIYINQQNENQYYWHPAQSSGSNGQTQYDHTFNGESNGYGIPLTITNNKGRCMHFAMPVKGFFNVGGGSYCRIECKYHRKGGSNGTLSDGQRYIINLPGMMAPVWRW